MATTPPDLFDLPPIDTDTFHKLMYKYSRLGLGDCQHAQDLMIVLMATTLIQLGYGQGIKAYREFVENTKKEFVKGVLLHGGQ